MISLSDCGAVLVDYNVSCVMNSPLESNRDVEYLLHEFVAPELLAVNGVKTASLLCDPAAGPLCDLFAAGKTMLRVS
jgi:hypothetical protein